MSAHGIEATRSLHQTSDRHRADLLGLERRGHGQLCDTIDDLRIADWTHTYNNEWLIQRHGHHTPRAAFHQTATAVAA